MFCGIGRLGLYLLPIGFADARILVLALRVVMIPAFAMETVCCSMTSWRTDRVESDILSNSSIQQIPPSDKTKAPLAISTYKQMALPFQNQLLGVNITSDVCCQTNCTASFAAGIYPSGSNLV